MKIDKETKKLLDSGEIMINPEYDDGELIVEDFEEENDSREIVKVPDAIW